MSHANVSWFGRSLPDECFSKLKELATAGHRINCVAFPAAGGNSWSIITDRTFFNRNIPQECHDQMRAFSAAGHKVEWAAFPPGGGNSWSILTDRTFFNRNIAPECHEKMKAYAAAGHKLRCVAFPPAGGNSWSVITDRTFFNRGIPDECHDRMKAMALESRMVSVSFPPAGGNRWSAISETSFFNRGVNSECHRVMRAMRSSGLGPLQAVAFHADGGFALLSRGDALTAAHPSLASGLKVFSLDRLAENIRAQLDGKGCKYALFVRHGNAIRFATKGPKRTSVTAPAQDFTIFDRFNPASVAKTVSSVALLQQLQAKQLSVDELIHHYLPASWSKPSSVRTITMAELLNHTSGFRGGATSYDDLRALVEAGIKLEDKVDSYANCNTAVARIVTAYLAGHVAVSGVDQAKATADLFMSLVQTNIFDKLGVPDVKWKADAETPTLFFPIQPGQSTGTTYGDWTLRPGSAGVHVSMAELAIFVNALANSSTLLSSGMRAQMDTAGLGWARTEDVVVGWYHRKRGYFPAAQNGDAELNSGIYKFSTGVQAVLLHNGPGGVDMSKAYNDAFAAPQISVSTAPAIVAVPRSTEVNQPADEPRPLLPDV